MRTRTFTRCAALAAAAAALAAGQAGAAFVVRSVGGSADPASITAAVNAFRADLGDPNNGNMPGPLFSGRREINWDGGGAAALATVFPSPMTTFNSPPTTRGAVFTTPGGSFEISGQPSPEFGDINPTYPTTFGVFSAPRLFTPLGSNVLDVFFFIPGTDTLATVSGFGAVFTDVDLLGSARLEFFDFFGALLFAQDVAPGTVGSESLSFLGASGDAGERIFRVRITSGTAALGPNDNPLAGLDLVVMDDFLYGEPSVAGIVPEPSGLALLGLGGLALLGYARRRQRAA
jgi:hypothetical protein